MHELELLLKWAKNRRKHLAHHRRYWSALERQSLDWAIEKIAEGMRTGSPEMGRILYNLLASRAFDE